jgi:hypothetical protein
MDNAMVLRQLNYDLRIARNGLKIVKVQAHVVYQENQDLKREVDRLKVKLQNANEDKLATISAERKRWAREDFKALAIRDLDQQANGLIKIIKDYGVSQFSGRDQVKYVEYENIRHTIDRLQKEAKALKDQG